MRQALRIVPLFIAWLIGSIIIAHLWVTNPDSFPSLPTTLWIWADSFYKSSNAEEISDLEFIVTLSTSAAAMLLAWCLGYFLWRMLRSMR